MTGADLIKHFEGCRLTAYPDPATGGKPWTIGYGCTGPGVLPGLSITQATADEMLQHRLDVLVPRVQNICPKATPCQLAALVSLAWNIGDGNISTSTVVRELNAGNVQASADAFRMWNHAAGRVNQGLINRREAERRVFLGGAL